MSTELTSIGDNITPPSSKDSGKSV
ncbi:hypothetical protein Golob_012739, partial [Gossypium lobatum]|nr:hypothetical protein [Gossypium lobatum]